MEPKKTFKKQKKKASLVEGAKHIVVSSVISGAILLSLVISQATVYTALTYLLWTPIISVIGWLIGSGILYMVARLLGGKGNYTMQAYLMSLYTAPISIISTITLILLIVPVVGILAMILTFIYSVYLLVLVLKETHDYSTGRAFLTWLIPFIVIMAIIIVIIAGILALYFMSVPAEELLTPAI